MTVPKERRARATKPTEPCATPGRATPSKAVAS
jgi:hypothetical protein